MMVLELSVSGLRRNNNNNNNNNLYFPPSMKQANKQLYGIFEAQLRLVRVYIYIYTVYIYIHIYILVYTQYKDIRPVP
jgi:hypothetical protein